MKPFYRDHQFWSLLAINIIIIIYYFYYHTSFKTLVWVYWSQSIVIGVFNFLHLVTIENIVPGSIEMNKEKVKTPGQVIGCIGPFFAFHYGFFHLVYLVFLFSITDANEKLDYHLLQVAVGTLVLDQLWNFIRLREYEKTHPANVGVLFFLPYLRVVPMHLTIILPAFIGISSMVLFLFLKTGADLLGYIITRAIYGKDSDVSVTAPGDVIS
ncbi:MAG: DUF6498-containing protein [Chitinophagales bacterium]